MPSWAGFRVGTAPVLWLRDLLHSYRLLFSQGLTGGHAVAFSCCHVFPRTVRVLSVWCPDRIDVGQTFGFIGRVCWEPSSLLPSPFPPSPLLTHFTAGCQQALSMGVYPGTRSISGGMSLTLEQGRVVAPVVLNLPKAVTLSYSSSLLW